MCPRHHYTICGGGRGTINREQAREGESDRNLSNEQRLKTTNIVSRVSSFQQKSENDVDANTAGRERGRNWTNNDKLMGNRTC